jgi:hypothetical protein
MFSNKRQASTLEVPTVKKQRISSVPCINDVLVNDVLTHIISFLFAEKHRGCATIPLVCQNFKRIYDSLELERFRFFLPKNIHRIVSTALIHMLDQQMAGSMKFTINASRRDDKFEAHMGVRFNTAGKLAIRWTYNPLQRMAGFFSWLFMDALMTVNHLKICGKPLDGLSCTEYAFDTLGFQDFLTEIFEEKAISYSRHRFFLGETKILCRFDGDDKEAILENAKGSELVRLMLGPCLKTCFPERSFEEALVGTIEEFGHAWITYPFDFLYDVPKKTMEMLCELHKSCDWEKHW